MVEIKAFSYLFVGRNFIFVFMTIFYIFSMIYYFLYNLNLLPNYFFYLIMSACFAVCFSSFLYDALFCLEIYINGSIFQVKLKIYLLFSTVLWPVLCTFVWQYAIRINK